MDGVDTIIRMATSYGSDIGLSAQSMIGALLLTQFIGFPATLVFGRYSDKFGHKQTLSFCDYHLHRSRNIQFPDG